MPRQQVFSEAVGVPDYDGRRTARPRAASPKFPCTRTDVCGKFGAVTNRQPKTIIPARDKFGLFTGADLLMICTTTRVRWTTKFRFGLRRRCHPLAARTGSEHKVDECCTPLTKCPQVDSGQDSFWCKSTSTRCGTSKSKHSDLGQRLSYVSRNIGKIEATTQLTRLCEARQRSTQ